MILGWKAIAAAMATAITCVGCMTVESAAVVRPASDRTYPVPVAVAHSEAVSTLMALGWQVTQAGGPEGVIHARTPMTIWTAGDLVTVYVVRVGEASSRVDVTSASGQQFDWGKNKENLERFYSALDRAIASRATRSR